MESEFGTTVAELRANFRAMEEAHRGDLRQHERDIVTLRPAILKTLDRLEQAARLPGSRLDQTRLADLDRRIAERRAAFLEHQRSWGAGRMLENESRYRSEMRVLGTDNADFVRWLKDLEK